MDGSGSVKWLFSLQHVFERIRRIHVQKPFPPARYTRKVKCDVVLELLLLFLCGGIKEERPGVTTSVPGNPHPLHSAGKLAPSDFPSSI